MEVLEMKMILCKKKVITAVIAVAMLISSMGFASVHASAQTTTEAEVIEAYGGTEKMQKYGIEVYGSGSSASGTLSGTITGYTMEALYEAYDLKETDNYRVLFARIKGDRTRTVLKEVFKNTTRTKADYNLKFNLSGNDYGITAVYITTKSVTLTYNGETKKFISNRPQDGGAVTEDGEIYDGFEVDLN
jgi:hypothetical protein